MSEKQRKLLAGGGIAVFILLTAAVFWFVGRPLVEFISQPDLFRDWVDTHGIWGRIAFVAIAALQVFVAIIPGEPVEIGAGYAFGFWEGTLLCLIGMTIGSALVFAFVRRFGIKAVEVFIPREKILSSKLLRDPKRVYAFFIAAFLLPGTPKDVLTYCVGLTNIPMGRWLIISNLCRLPSLVSSTMGGDALGTEQYLQAVIVFGVTICLSVGGMLLYRRLQRAKEGKDHGTSGDSQQDQ
jgi:uncharacterized membrane protein YdjX (TVP38/TMEM64 family)